MTSLFDYYHSQSYKHISSQSKKAIRSSVFSHIKLQHQAQTSHTSSPSRWTLLTSYQTHRRYRYVYTSLALIGIVSGIYFTDTRPQISYLAWGPVIQTQTQYCLCKWARNYHLHLRKSGNHTSKLTCILRKIVWRRHPFAIQQILSCIWTSMRICMIGFRSSQNRTLSCSRQLSYQCHRRHNF